MLLFLKSFFAKQNNKKKTKQSKAKTNRQTKKIPILNFLIIEKSV